MILIEPVFGVDDFGKAKYQKRTKALITTVLMILFGKPGMYPSLPEIGMNIQQYRNELENNIDCNVLKSQLVLQCALLQDDISTSNINIEKMYDEHGDLVLLITTPVIQEPIGNILAIGIKTDSSGNMIYNYELVQSFM